MKELDRNSVESSELVEQTFKFWFNDNDHIRSPFPNYIQNELKQLATDRFYEWASTVNPEAKDEVNDEVVAEKFEEIILSKEMLNSVVLMMSSGKFGGFDLDKLINKLK